MTAELAGALLARGHRVAIYAPRRGALAETVMARGVPVTDRIETIGFVPDIIHGHHNTSLAVAMVRFPVSRAIFVCHDSAMIYDEPILDRRIGAYIAVDQGCAARLLVAGVAESRIHLVPNAVDLSRYVCRATWADTPRTALAVTKERAPWLGAVRTACERTGIELAAVGPAVRNSVDDLPARMAESDIVFAWSRSAAEAAATGATVILCDEHGFGGMLNVADAETYPNGLFGQRVLPTGTTTEGVVAAIAAHTPDNARGVAAIVRRKLSLSDMVDAYERLYTLTLAEPPFEGKPHAAHGLAGFLERALPRFDLPSDLHRSGEALAARLTRLDSWLGGRARLDNTVPDRLRFDAASATVGLLGDGWAVPESWGIWSVGAVATLDIPIALVAAWDGRLAVNCKHYFPATDPPETERAVEIMLGGRLIARWQFRRRDYGRAGLPPRELTLSESCWRDVNGSIRLAFHMPHAVAPLDAGEGEDARQLGLGLESVSSAPPPQPISGSTSSA